MSDAHERVGSRSLARRWRELHEPGAGGRRVLVAASFTANPLEAPLGVRLHERDGRAPEVAFAPHNQLFQLCLSPSLFGVAEGSEVVLLWRIEDLFERDFHSFCEGQDGAGARIVAAAAGFARLVVRLASTPGVHVVLSDGPVPVGFGLDHRDGELLARLAGLTHAVNATVDGELAGAPIDRVRLSSLQLARGTEASFDRRTWLMYRQPFSDAFVVAVGTEIAEVMHRRTAAAPKVVVLDCDNSLWGGVAGDDGVSALQCSDAFPGSAYRAFQQAARRLRHQGVLLALASKNDDTTVRDVFGQLDGMVLTDDDIVARRVNWDPKPGNIKEIAEELNLGLDAFVFVDDSDHELGSVHAELPMVRTLRVPDDIEELPDLFSASGWFRGLRVSADDRERTGRMQAEAERVQMASALTHEEFLESLALVVTVRAVDEGSIGRVVQLINKTNQFNVTTIRRSETELRRLLGGGSHLVRVMEVEDRFGEYGLVGVAIVELRGPRPAFDSFLMSCRVLGRGVETAFLASVVEEIRAQCDAPIVGCYEATAKNGLVADLFARHGFEPTDSPGHFELPVRTGLAVPAHVTVVRA